MFQRPSKIIRTELQKMQEENLSSSDLKSAAKAVYRKRRRTRPPLPKTQDRDTCQFWVNEYRN